MARQRRGGFRPPELRGTLGTLLRTTLAQAGAVREVIERGAREGRSRLDGVLANRRRQDAITELGEIVLDLIRRGEIDLGELPEVRDLVAHLDEVDAEHQHSSEDTASPPVRRRFDERSGRDDGTVSSKTTWVPPTRAKAPGGVWRPQSPEAPTRPDRPDAIRQQVPGRKSAISFDDDDLADYMHPDDVPPKDPPEGDA